MEELLLAWVTNSFGTFENYSNNFLVDLGGSLAVASRGLFSTGVSTDLNGKAV